MNIVFFSKEIKNGYFIMKDIKNKMSLIVDIFTNVVQYVNDQKTLINLLSVNKNLRNYLIKVLNKKPQLIENLEFVFKGYKKEKKFKLRQLVTKAKFINSIPLNKFLNLKCATLIDININFNDRGYLISNLPNVKHITLKECIPYSDKVLHKFKKLETVVLNNTPFNNNTFKFLTKVKKIEIINNVNYIYNKYNNILFRNCFELETIVIYDTGNGYYPKNGKINIYPDNCTKLKTFNLNIKDDLFLSKQDLFKFTKLKNFKIKNVLIKNTDLALYSKYISISNIDEYYNNYCKLDIFN